MQARFKEKASSSDSKFRKSKKLSDSKFSDLKLHLLSNKAEIIVFQRSSTILKIYNDSKIYCK